ncbi:uncharacterized protein LOC120345853 [Styela clava]
MNGIHTHSNGHRRSRLQEPPPKSNGLYVRILVAQIVFALFAAFIGLALYTVCTYSLHCNTVNWDCECNTWTNVSANLWGSIIVVIASGFALCKAKNPSKLSKHTSLVTTLVGTLVCAIAICLEAMAATSKFKLFVVAHKVFHSLGCVVFCIILLLFIWGFLIDNTEQLCSTVLVKVQPSTNYSVRRATQEAQEDLSKSKSRGSQDSFPTTSGQYAGIPAV